MVKELSRIQMAAVIPEGGKMINDMDMEHLDIRMGASSMKEASEMAGMMVKELIGIQMVPLIPEGGRTATDTVMDFTGPPMVRIIGGNGGMIKNAMLTII